jgi:hypothetical protein
MRLYLSELYALCVNTHGTVSVIILFIIMAMITMFGWFLVLFSNRFFFFLRFSFYKNCHYVIVYCHHPKLNLNSQNMTLIKLDTLDTNSILFPQPWVDFIGGCTGVCTSVGLGQLPKPNHDKILSDQSRNKYKYMF